jgi:hypothetical protein
MDEFVGEEFDEVVSGTEFVLTNTSNGFYALMGNQAITSG